MLEKVNNEHNFRNILPFIGWVYYIFFIYFHGIVNHRKITVFQRGKILLPLILLFPLYFYIFSFFSSVLYFLLIIFFPKKTFSISIHRVWKIYSHVWRCLVTRIYSSKNLIRTKIIFYLRWISGTTARVMKFFETMTSFCMYEIY